MGVLDANGVCGSCHCLCSAQDFPSASIQIAAPVVVAAAPANPVTTLQTVVTFASQAGSTAAVAQGDAGAASQPGAVAADSSVAAAEVQPSTAAVLDAAQSDSAPSLVAQGGASSVSDTATTTDVSSQSTDTAVSDTAATTAAQPSISESAGGIFAESQQAPTVTTDTGAQPTTTTSPSAAVTLAPPVPGALAVENGAAGPVAPIDINTYSLASAIALGHLRRR